jgi:hypothetical protein
MKRNPKPQRKQQLLAQLSIIERDIRRMFGAGYTDDDLARNRFGDPGKTITGSAHYVPLPSWVAQDASPQANQKSQTNQNVSQNGMCQIREAAKSNEERDLTHEEFTERELAKLKK